MATQRPQKTRNAASTRAASAASTATAVAAAAAATTVANATTIAGALRTPNRVWMGLFGIWGVFLTGFTWGFSGSPGFLQQYRLHSLHEMKLADLASLEAEIEAMNQESDRLEKSTFAQEREVRKTLGYVAADEMIFDFSASPFSYQASEALLSAENAQKKAKKRQNRL